MDDGSDSYSDDSAVSQTRQNRYHGPPSTWRSLTAEDRAINTSLVQQRNEDLSIHLYNAHALKRRVNEAEEKKEPHDDFVPPKVWTAWPLPPDSVPREEEIVGEEDGLQDFTLKREVRYRPSRELEDVLIGKTLRIAKERFNGREWASDEERESNAQEEDAREVREGSNDDSQTDDGENTPAVMQNEALPILKPVISADDDRSKELLRPTIRHNLSRIDELLMALHHSRQACMRAMSDDSGTDYTEPTTRDQSEEDSETTIASPSKRQKISSHGRMRGRGRPRKHSSGTISYPEQPKLEREKPKLVESPLPKKRAGRPKKEYSRLKDESDYEYIVRIAQLRKRPIPPPPNHVSRETPSSIPGTSTASARSSPSRRSSIISKSSRKIRIGHDRWQPRDWTDVIGAAAIIGFSEDVIARAKQRCATLFGEGMVMRTLDHELPPAGELVSYLPGKIDSALDDDSSVSEDEDKDQEGENDHVKPSKSKKSSSMSKPTAEADADDEAEGAESGKKPRSRNAGKETHWCSVSKCLRSKSGFFRGNHLKRHLIVHHGYDKSSPELDRTVNSSKGSRNEHGEIILDVGEKDRITMEGGIHVDGFMKLIPARKAARGKDLEQRKTRKIAKGYRKKGGSRAGSQVRRGETVEEMEVEVVGDDEEIEETAEEAAEPQAEAEQEAAEPEPEPKAEPERRSSRRTTRHASKEQVVDNGAIHPVDAMDQDGDNRKEDELGPHVPIDEGSASDSLKDDVEDASD